MNVRGLQKKLRVFAAKREWDQFHSPKNLVMALAGESGELLEHFQWLTEKQSLSLAADREKVSAVSAEIADIAIYLIRLCDKLDVNLERAIEDKMAANARKYPVSLARGNAAKYTEFIREKTGRV